MKSPQQMSNLTVCVKLFCLCFYVIFLSFFFSHPFNYYWVSLQLLIFVHLLFSFSSDIWDLSEMDCKLLFPAFDYQLGAVIN